MRKLSAFIVLILMSLVICPAALFAQRQFPHPDRIRYDGQCLTVDGKDMFVFSGAFHYFRCPKELWRDRFAKIKQAGFNTVETYVAWDWHEREMPADVNDFSKVDMSDLADWLKMAHEEFGLYTIVRPGPYICAEWADGGYPVWLLSKRPESIEAGRPWLRTDDPVYLAWCKHWYDACCKVIAPEQITRKPAGKPGVILFQIENEYDLYGPPSQPQRMGQLKALYQDARDAGIDIPIFTCWTRQVRGSKDPDLKNVFDAANSYERWNIAGAGRKVDDEKRDQPDAPGMISELQGGWFSGVGGMLAENQDGVTASQCNGITLMAMSHGATILNYYMLFGGTNFGDWGARTQTTTYDYNAPIREPGGVGDKYAVVWGIGHMIQEFGPALARAKELSCKPEGFDPDIVIAARRAADGQTFLFVWNKSRQQANKGQGSVTLGDDLKPLKVSYELEPFGFKVLVLPKGADDSSNGRWFPEPMPAITRPSVPAAIKVTEAQRAADPLPTHWHDTKPGLPYSGQGIYDSRYVYYRAKPTLTPEQAQQFKTLRIVQEQSDPVIVRVNGKVIASSNEFGLKDVSIALGDTLHAGENDIVALYENQGYANFGPGIEVQAGAESAELIHRKTSDVMLTNWRSKLLEGSGFRPQPGDMIDAGYDDSSWEAFVLDARTAADFEEPIQPGAIVTNAAGRVLAYRRGAAVFRTSFELTDQMIKQGLTELYFDRIDDRGTIYVNGKEVGRSRNWDRPLSIDAHELLKPGKNVVAVVVTNRDGPGGLTRPVKLVATVVDRVPLKLQIAENLGGVEAGWTGTSNPDTSAWKRVSLGESSDRSAASSDPSDALVTWYRTEFELPAKDPKIWVPWLARISASGNGMIYLNGHHLGRWWEIGPQRDYFLPECWLNFGQGQKNVLTFSLRRTDRGAELKGMEIAPYADYAEQR